MFLIVGLGNPGSKYELTRHNAGFLVLDQLLDKAGIRWESESQKFSGVWAKGTLLGKSCVFLKPQTFMNVSGRSVRDVIRFFKIEEQNLIVVHDDVDVPSGTVRARAGGGHGGNNGVRSIIAETGLTNFHRIKLGVGKPTPEMRMDVASWVLAPFSDEELKLLASDMTEAVTLRIKNIFDQY